MDLIDMQENTTDSNINRFRKSTFDEIYESFARGLGIPIEPPVVAKNDNDIEMMRPFVPDPEREAEESRMRSEALWKQTQIEAREYWENQAKADDKLGDEDIGSDMKILSRHRPDSSRWSRMLGQRQDR
jgi:hypothetical protein